MSIIADNGSKVARQVRKVFRNDIDQNRHWIELLGDNQATRSWTPIVVLREEDRCDALVNAISKANQTRNIDNELDRQPIKLKIKIKQPKEPKVPKKKFKSGYKKPLPPSPPRQPSPPPVVEKHKRIVWDLPQNPDEQILEEIGIKKAAPTKFVIPKQNNRDLIEKQRALQDKLNPQADILGQILNTMDKAKDKEGQATQNQHESFNESNSINIPQLTRLNPNNPLFLGDKTFDDSESESDSDNESNWKRRKSHKAVHTYEAPVVDISQTVVEVHEQPKPQIDNAAMNAPERIETSEIKAEHERLMTDVKSSIRPASFSLNSEAELLTPWAVPDPICEMVPLKRPGDPIKAPIPAKMPAPAPKKQAVVAPMVVNQPLIKKLTATTNPSRTNRLPPARIEPSNKPIIDSLDAVNIGPIPAAKKFGDAYNSRSNLPLVATKVHEDLLEKYRAEKAKAKAKQPFQVKLMQEVDLFSSDLFDPIPDTLPEQPTPIEDLPLFGSPTKVHTETNATLLQQLPTASEHNKATLPPTPVDTPPKEPISPPPPPRKRTLLEKARSIKPTAENDDYKMTARRVLLNNDLNISVGTGRKSFKIVTTTTTTTTNVTNTRKKMRVVVLRSAKIVDGIQL